MAYIRMGRPAACSRGTNVVPGGFSRDGAQRFSLSVRPLLLLPLGKLSASNGSDERNKSVQFITESPASSETA